MANDKLVSGAYIWWVLESVNLETPLSTLTKFINDESGATAIEYGLIAALIAVAAIAAMKGIGTKLGTTFNNVSNQL